MALSFWSVVYSGSGRIFKTSTDKSLMSRMSPTRAYRMRFPNILVTVDVDTCNQAEACAVVQ